jgi:hypothetical protein
MNNFISKATLSLIFGIALAGATLNFMGNLPATTAGGVPRKLARYITAGFGVGNQPN